MTRKEERGGDGHDGEMEIRKGDQENRLFNMCFRIAFPGPWTIHKKKSRRYKGRLRKATLLSSCKQTFGLKVFSNGDKIKSTGNNG